MDDKSVLRVSDVLPKPRPHVAYIHSQLIRPHIAVEKNGQHWKYPHHEDYDCNTLKIYYTSLKQCYVSFCDFQLL